MTANILLVGSGGVGTIAALNLEAGGLASVTAVLRSNYSKVTTDGFHIKSIDHGEITHWRPSEILNKIPHYSNKHFDYIVVTTKNIADTTPTTAELIAPAVTPGKTVIVLIQNGLNIEKPLFEIFPQNVVLSGVSRVDSHEIASGVIEQVDHDRLIIGAFRNPTPNLNIESGVDNETDADAAARHFVQIYSAAGKTDCRYVPAEEVPFYRWQKLVYNACMNTICAITGLDTGRIQLAEGAVENLVRPAMNEIVAAAAAVGVRLPADIVDKMIAIDPVTAYLRPSMLEDVGRGNLTEFENILGEPLREGTARGVSMPTATFLYHTLKAIQWRVKEEKGMVTIPSRNV
ncbi:hypothetical protein ASPVEDRAFT_42920 [Aspergillus versicolor CBS 583.65]|uniref:2-dehydropantoate 2-reductase n=1 Tax=Aspergillus versicolor CBS 583.65 TaxID=1036611 RepID=A0A1L9PPS3_ASPVE|nr:uncharacterized protein ASPVEDRAFT_42920 [Aspergillus versicolor CBS 583.65]OJJ03462.1 hypothetical protein ASPVEDRAFT_42920 [Aspergillus versicolor CBS 583.65]